MKRSFPLILVIGLLLTSSLAYAGEVATFDSFYVESSTVGWILALTLALGAAGAVFATGGTASPLVAWIGSTIGGTMGLSGAAATNAGLALLGGGSIASGGFGVIGGTALLTLVMSFSSDVAADYTIGTALNEYNYSQFVEASKEMTTLPLPQNHDGPEAYEAAFPFLEQIDDKQMLSSNETQKLLNNAIEETFISQPDLSMAEKARVSSLVALLAFQTNDYDRARTFALHAINDARAAELRRTLPAFIYATAMLYQKQYDFAKVTTEFFRYSILAEPDNKLIPLLYSIYLDRMMYRIYDGFLHPEDFQRLVEIAQENSIAEFSFALMSQVLFRHFVMLKDSQQRIGAITSSASTAIRDNPRTIEELNTTLERYQVLLSGTKLALSKMEGLSLDGEEKDKLLELFKLYSDYAIDNARLKGMVADFTAAQKQQGESTIIRWLRSLF